MCSAHCSIEPTLFWLLLDWMCASCARHRHVCLQHIYGAVTDSVSALTNWLPGWFSHGVHMCGYQALVCDVNCFPADVAEHNLPAVNTHDREPDKHVSICVMSWCKLVDQCCCLTCKYNSTRFQAGRSSDRDRLNLITFLMITFHSGT